MKRAEHLLKRSTALLICMSMAIVSLAVAVGPAASAPDDAVFEGTVTIGGMDAPDTLVMYSLGDGPPSGNSTVTDEYGNYELWVVGGETYTLYFANGDAMFDMSAFSEESILPGETVVVDADLNPAPARTVTLMGYVTNASDPADAVTSGHVLGMQGIGVGDDMPDYINWSSLDPSTGYYEMDLLEGNVGAAVFDAPGYYPAMPTEMLTLGAGESGWMNLSLFPLGYGNVNLSGQVTDMISTLPISGADVYAENYDMSVRASTSTNGTGEYELLMMEGEGQMVVQADGYASQAMHDIYMEGNMTVDFELLPVDAEIWGYVLNADTMAPIEDAEVWTSTWVADGVDMFNTTSSDDIGYYSMQVASGYGWWVDAEARGYGEGGGENVWIESGETIQVDILLSPEDSVIRGYINDSGTGDPVPGAYVGIMIDPGYPDGDRDPDNGTSTDGTGYYEIDCVSGSYAMFFTAAGYMMEFQDGYDVEVGPGESVWVNHSLVPATTEVFGTAMDSSTLAPLDNVRIGIGGVSPNAGYSMLTMTSTDGSGDYSVMVNGEYSSSISGERDGYEPYYDFIDIPDVLAYEYDFYMVPIGGPSSNYTVMGYVRESGSLDPLVSSNVIASTGVFWEDINSTFTNSTGYYEFEVPCMVMDIMAVSYGHLASSVEMMPAAPDAVVWLNFTLDLHTVDPVVDASADPAESLSLQNPGDLWADVTEPYLLAVGMDMYRITSNGSDYAWVESITSLNYIPDFGWGSMEGYETSPGEWQIGLFDWDTTLGEQALLLSDDTATEYVVTNFWRDMGAVRVSGQYTNSTMPGFDYGELWFDVDGDYLGVRVGGGPEPDMYATMDPTGEFTIDYGMERYNFTIASFDGSQRRLLMTDSIQMVVLDALPSGSYTSMFFAQDWAMLSGFDRVNFSVDNDPPVADAGADVIAVVDTTVSFDGTMSDDNVLVVEYEWVIANGTGAVVDVLYGAEPDHVFDTVDDYAVTLYVRDAGGNEATDEMTVTIVPDEPPVADAGPDRAVDEDEEVVFDGSGSSDDVDIVNYTWTIAELSVELYGETASYTFAEPGTYTVELVVTDTAMQTSSDTATVEVGDVTAPTADAGLDVTVPVGSTVTLDGELSGDNVGVVNYSWDMDVDDVVLYGESVSYSYDEPGEYTVVLEVTDAAGNSDTDEVVVTVVDDTDPVADAGPDQSVETGTEVTFDGVDSSDNVGIEEYLWTFDYDGEPQELTGIDPSFTFDEPGDYVVTLEVTDAAGNSDTDTVTIRVSEAPVADAGDDITAAVGAEVTFDGSDSSDDVGIEEYTWTFTYDGEEQELSGVSPEFTFEIAGVYTVTLTVTDAAGLTDTDTVTVTVEDDGDASDESFIESYWWVIAIIVIVVAGAAAVAAMMRGRKGKGPSSVKEETPEEVFEDLPPPPEDLDI